MSHPSQHRAAALAALLTVVTALFLTAAPARAADPVIAAAGDIACDPLSSSYHGGLGTAHACHAPLTAGLIAGDAVSGVLPLGDNQYYCGSLRAFQTLVRLSWGQVPRMTHPTSATTSTSRTGRRHGPTAPPNAGAAGYFGYFGAAAGTPGRASTATTSASWHLIALDTNCTSAGGCGTSSPQGKWLAADLAAQPEVVYAGVLAHPAVQLRRPREPELAIL